MRLCSKLRKHNLFNVSFTLAFQSKFGSSNPVLVLLFVALWFILRGDLLCVVPCVILFLCFSVLLVLRLPRLGKRERAYLSAFRTFARFVLVWICRFPLGVWEELRFVIVALPGRFSYLFLNMPIWQSCAAPFQFGLLCPLYGGHCNPWTKSPGPLNLALVPVIISWTK